MSLQIQMIGTGSAFSKKYYNNNALVYSNGFKLLVDCGSTAPRALHELKVPMDDIDGILITHIHADHVGGLEEFAFRFKYTYQKQIKLFVPAPLLDSLWNHSLRGGLENPSEGLHGLNDYFQVIALRDTTPIQLFPGLRVQLIATVHIPGKPSFALLFNDKVFYSSDTVFDYSLLVRLYETRQCEYFLHDCQLTSPGLVHASLDDLLTLPESVQQQLLLMHYDDTKDSYMGRTGNMNFIEQHRLYDFP
ncbi:MBL fold metallo-hydrolase [Paenibacillus rigui]|uniref:MBL fold metallo-hydrolase n=1 Tax=Paenibacillus rigui TaxID=554312 RepID=A0A229USC7_9BACL|nr:MBL fold metallo-hydrolase [Paenibacillus rigui]OXM86233.1 MBL fold metallo-hydrolase [Paenibacillus rigui]